MAASRSACTTVSTFVVLVLRLSSATPYPAGFVWSDHPSKAKARVVAVDDKLLDVHGAALRHAHALGALPSKVDWRGTRVTAIRDQGTCGSCWAFSAVGAIEGSLAGATSTAPVPLSVEQILLCCQGTFIKGCAGCAGGEPFQAYEYLMNTTHGLDAEADYPYDAPSPFKNHTCRAREHLAKARVTGWAYAVPRASPDDGQHADPIKEMALAAVVAKHGPVSIAIDASRLSRYHRGVYNGPCSSSVKDLTHAMLIVGYDLEANYWIVKNSYGTSFGEDGYIRMVMGKNICGITDEATLVNVTAASASTTMA